MTNTEVRASLGDFFGLVEQQWVSLGFRLPQIGPELQQSMSEDPSRYASDEPRIHREPGHAVHNAARSPSTSGVPVA